MYDSVVYPVRGRQKCTGRTVQIVPGQCFHWVDVTLIILRSHLFSHCREIIRLKALGHWVLIVTHITPGTVVSNATLSFYWSLNRFDVHHNIPYIHQSTCLALEERTNQSSVQLDAVYGRWGTSTTNDVTNRIFRKNERKLPFNFLWSWYLLKLYVFWY